MKRHKTWFSLGLVALSALALTLILTILPAGAEHNEPASVGTVEVEPQVVSSNNDVGMAARTITITVTDPNLNTIQFVGTGPNGEASDVSDGNTNADGEDVPIPNNIQVPGTFLASLGQGSIADRNHDGQINASDIQVRTPSTGLIVAVASIFDAERGIVSFNVSAGDGADDFKVRYATSERELTRGPDTITKTIVTDSALNPGGRLDVDLDPASLPLRDGDDAGTAVTPADITVAISGRTGDALPTVTDIGNIASAPNADGFVSGNTITLELDGDEDAIPSGTTIKVTYPGWKDLVTVQGAGDETMPLRLRETTSSSGKFTATVVAVNSEDGAVDDSTGVGGANIRPATVTDAENRPTLAVIDGSSVIVSYRDQSPTRTVTARVDVESDVPTFSNVTPANDAETNDLDTLLTAEVSDNIAGVDPAKGTSVNVTVQGAPVNTADFTVEETAEGSGVYVISYNINKIPQIATEKKERDGISAEIEWQVSVKDKAGNLAMTDADDKTDGNQMTVLNVKTTAPTLDGARTGEAFDASKTDDEDTPNVDERIVSSRTSIKLEFDRGMGGSSLQTSDFMVDGEEPTGVDHFSAVPNYVFLTVPEMAPDATPKIEIVGDVQDAGGNSINTASASGSVINAATDGIAPKLTVTIEDDYTTGDIQITVVSDEPIRGSQPGVVINNCGDTVKDCDGGRTTGSEISPRVIKNRQEWSFAVTGLGTGLYIVTSSATDVASNNATGGGHTDSTNAAAIKFEIDKALPTVATTDDNNTPNDNTDDTTDYNTDPLPDGKKSEAEPFFIEIDWSSEDEYPGDSHKSVTLTKAVLNAGKDNERDVLALSSTSNDRNFTIAISEIGVGKHTLTYNGMDEAGNTLKDDATLSFEVVVPPALTLTLQPGMNLVSVPRDPADTDVQAVFGDVEEVTLIFTQPRDGESDLPWLFAARDPVTGEFAGDLKTIDARHAYWVKASGSSKAEIDIPQLEAQRRPPSISIKANTWNLVPVISLDPIASDPGDNEIELGATFCAGSYFGANLSNAFTYESGRWTAVGADGDVKIGSGYWIQLSQDGSITPATVRECPAPNGNGS